MDDVYAADVVAPADREGPDEDAEQSKQRRDERESSTEDDGTDADPDSSNVYSSTGLEVLGKCLPSVSWMAGAFAP
ncbi:hypothetical protein [Natronobacterium gregoryi]|uniref:Uncharacterized protein n=2 Tax=Natronobacterium gregoryi TaxID=44930 RepID=L0AHI5_NATGS|nr:hypothetical protein [Natronobacterium gregoryi]AFZ72909.1 hypothetical protein Natgr_1712 [Natronobacterium gregoryi SP2]ELY69794.1 hypothetical protein C490_07331 [Natronobacterium gregoryi SP2]PLK21862.1 hypothetical protein CYV19_01835 [Natronobacterium gregoryi SP2]SFI66969.1 hypothetical protein SAMN05443661_10377 [Natronobacterium gregoryi]